MKKYNIQLQYLMSVLFTFFLLLCYKNKILTSYRNRFYNTTTSRFYKQVFFACFIRLVPILLLCFNLYFNGKTAFANCDNSIITIMITREVFINYGAQYNMCYSNRHFGKIIIYIIIHCHTGNNYTVL